MQVKEVISQALRLVGRGDVADATEGDLTDEQARLKRAFLTYFNAVLDELARGYFPLDAVESHPTENGRLPLCRLARTPVRIRRVTDGSVAVNWHILPDYLYADPPEITVYYEYSPDSLGEEDEFVYPDYAVGANLVEYAMAAEHYLVLGNASASASWENKYRAEIENLQSRTTGYRRVPPRRWI